MPAPDTTSALRDELVAALDHDLRTALTTVLGALQTLARAQPSPADPDLAPLLASALAQAQHMRCLLDELPWAASLNGPQPLAPADLAWLVRGATNTGDGGPARVDVPDDLPPVVVSAPGLRRVLAGILGRGGGIPGARVTVAADGADCRITITREGGEVPGVSGSGARLLQAMGGRVEETAGAESPGLCLVFPAACRAGS